MPDREERPNSRRYKRVPMVGKSTVYFPDENKTITGMIDNINRGGVGLLMKNPLPLEKHVVVRLEFPDPDGITVNEEIRGRIVRSSEWNRIYITGIEFASLITEDEHPHLFSFLREAEKK